MPLVNNPTFSSATGSSILFDGSDDRGTLTYNSSFNIRTGITISAFLRRNSIFTQLSDCFILSRPPAWYFYDAYNSGSILADVYIDGGRTGRCSTPVPYDEKWYKIDYTYDSTSGWAVMYKNGQTASSTQVTGRANYLIDESSANFQNPFQSSVGKSYFVSNLSIYNRALTAAEISQNYYGGPIVTNGMVWGVDASNLVSYPGSGTVWQSLTGGVTGALTNGPVFDTGNGGNILFDGNNDYVDFGNPSSLNFGTGTSMTVSAWYQRFNSATTNLRLLAKGANSDVNAATQGFAFFGSNTNLSFIISDFPNARKSVGTSSSLSLNTWYYVTGVVDRGNSSMSIFINGVIQNTTTGLSSSALTGTSSFYVGANVPGSLVWNGRVAGAKIYNRALTAAEIKQNYDATKWRFGLD
jgi:hypothetical protein